MQTGQVVSRSISDVGLVQGLLVVPAGADRQRAAVRDLAGGDAVAVPATDPGGAGDRAGAVAGGRGLPARPVPGQLVRPAAVRRAGRPGRGGGDRRPGGQGLRPGGTARWTSSASGPAALFALRMRVVRLQAKYADRADRDPRRSARSGCCCSVAGWRCAARSRWAPSWPSPPTSASWSGRSGSVTALLTVGQQARAGVERVLEVIDSSPQVLDVTRRGCVAGWRPRPELRPISGSATPAPSRCCAGWT